MLLIRKFIFLIILLLALQPVLAEEFITVQEIHEHSEDEPVYQTRAKPVIKTPQIVKEQAEEMLTQPVKSTYQEIKKLPEKVTYKEIDLNTKIVKEPIIEDPKDKSQVYLKNQFGESIRACLNEKRNFYLKPYQTIYLGWLDQSDIKVAVYDVSNNFLGEMNRSIKADGEIETLTINRFVLSRLVRRKIATPVVDPLDKLLEEDAELVDLNAKNDYYVSDDLTKERKIKISNLREADIKIKIINKDDLNSPSWTIAKSLYAPRYLLLQGEPILISPESKIVLEDENNEMKIAKDLKIDDEGSYIWIVE